MSQDVESGGVEQGEDEQAALRRNVRELLRRLEQKSEAPETICGKFFACVLAPFVGCTDFLLLPLILLCLWPCFSWRWRRNYQAQQQAYFERQSIELARRQEIEEELREKYCSARLHVDLRRGPRGNFSGISCNDCAICLTELSKPCIGLPCDTSRHVFHEECLMTWLQKKNSCPLCAARLPASSEGFVMRYVD